MYLIVGDFKVEGIIPALEAGRVDVGVLDEAIVVHVVNPLG